MALITCPECRKQISDKSVHCVHCGFPLIEQESASNPLYNYKDLILKRLRTEKLSSVVVDISKETGISISEVKEYVSQIKNEPKEPSIKQAPRMIKCPQCDNLIYENETTCRYCGLTDIKAMIIAREERIKAESIIKDIPKCPYCGSMNIEKIGQLGKITSVGIWGLASNKIGKQWKCKNCGSMF